SSLRMKLNDAAETALTLPAAVDVQREDLLQLRVISNAIPPPTFQWRKNGVNISGATNDLLKLAAIQLSDSGSYSVIIANGAGSETLGGLFVRAAASSLAMTDRLGDSPLSTEEKFSIRTTN